MILFKCVTRKKVIQVLLLIIMQDCIGAIDGTDIDGWAKRQTKQSHGRKVKLLQNGVSACSFDKSFIFVNAS